MQNSCFFSRNVISATWAAFLTSWVHRGFAITLIACKLATLVWIYLSLVLIVYQSSFACQLLQVYPAHPPHTYTIHDEAGTQVHSVRLTVKVHILCSGSAIRWFVITETTRAKLEGKVCPSCSEGLQSQTHTEDQLFTEHHHNDEKERDNVLHCYWVLNEWSMKPAWVFSTCHGSLLIECSVRLVVKSLCI